MANFNHENSVSDTLKSFFYQGNSEEFCDQFCRVVSNNRIEYVSAEKTKLLVRETVTFTSDQDSNKKKKLTPDMLLISLKHEVVVVIENKIFANEGHGQSKAYSSAPFCEALINKLSKHGVTKTFEVIYAYITLLGDRASAGSTFYTIKWADLFQKTCADIHFQDENLENSRNELIHRSKELAEFIEKVGNPKLQITASDYFNQVNEEGWINQFVFFKVFFSNIANQFLKATSRDFTFSVFKGSYVTDMGVVIYVDTWNRNHLYANMDSLDEQIKTRSFHFILKTKPDGSARIQLNYEMFPYLSEKSFKQNFPEVAEKYYQKRSQFLSDVVPRLPRMQKKERPNPQVWYRSSKAMDKYGLEFARVTFQNYLDLSVNELVDWIGSSLLSGVKIVEEYLSTEN